MSQNDLGRRLGVAFQQVQKYEKGANRVSASRLEAIAKALRCDVTYFFPASGERKSDPTAFADSYQAMRVVRAFAGIASAQARAALVALAEFAASQLPSHQELPAALDQRPVNGASASPLPPRSGGRR